MIGNKNRINLNQRWEGSSLLLSETVEQGVLGRAAESFSRPRSKTVNRGPLRAKRAENFSIAPFRLA